MFHEVVNCSILDHYPFGEVILFPLRFFFLDWLQDEFCDISLKMSCLCWCNKPRSRIFTRLFEQDVPKAASPVFFLHNLKTSVLTLKWLRLVCVSSGALQVSFSSADSPMLTLRAQQLSPMERCTTRPVSAPHVYLFVHQTERFLASQNVGMTSVPAFKEVSMLLCSSHFQLLCQFYFRSTVRCYCRVWRVRVSDNS